jgi:hypothetical protein
MSNIERAVNTRKNKNGHTDFYLRLKDLNFKIQEFMQKFSPSKSKDSEEGDDSEAIQLINEANHFVGSIG